MQDLDATTFDTVFNAIGEALDSEGLGEYQGVEILVACLLRELDTINEVDFYSILKVDTVTWAVQISSHPELVVEMLENMEAEDDEPIH